MFPIDFGSQSDKGQGHSDCDKATWGGGHVLFDKQTLVYLKLASPIMG